MESLFFVLWGSSQGSKNVLVFFGYLFVRVCVWWCYVLTGMFMKMNIELIMKRISMVRGKRYKNRLMMRFIKERTGIN